MAEPIWSVSAGVHYYDNYAFLRKSEACILLVVAIFMENIGKWSRPQKRVDAGIREPKPPKVGSCWLAAQHYLLYSSLQLCSLLLQNSEGSHTVRLLCTQPRPKTIITIFFHDQRYYIPFYLWSYLWPRQYIIIRVRIDGGVGGLNPPPQPSKPTILVKI